MRVKRRVKRRWCSMGFHHPTNKRRAPTRKAIDMPLFMDVHNIDGGVPAADVAAAHQADLVAQGAHGVNYLRYWVDEQAGKIFCLDEDRKSVV